MGGSGMGMAPGGTSTIQPTDLEKAMATALGPVIDALKNVEKAVQGVREGVREGQASPQHRSSLGSNRGDPGDRN